jgi:hypothetical protein
MSSVFVPVKQPLLLVMRANSRYRTTSEESESISAVHCMMKDNHHVAGKGMCVGFLCIGVWCKCLGPDCERKQA